METIFFPTEGVKNLNLVNQIGCDFHLAEFTKVLNFFYLMVYFLEREA